MNSFSSFRDTPSFNFEKALKKANIKPNFSIIKVTGSNGKSVTASILSSIYFHNGYKVGLLLHHFSSLNNNLLFNNLPIPNEYIDGAIKKYEKVISKFDLSKFEVMSLIFFSYLEENKADIAIVELDEIYCQCQGYLDEFSEVASIATSLALDHTEELGSTLSLIATSFASNFASDSKIIIPKLDNDLKKLFLDIARNNKSTCYEVDSFFNYHLDENANFVFSYRPYGELRIASNCLFYLYDASLALETITQLNGIYPVSKEKIEEALLDLIPLNEGVRKGNVIYSSASNEEALSLLSRSFETLAKGSRIHCLLSLHENKNISSVISYLGNVVSSIAFTRVNSSCRDEFGYSLYLDDYPYIDSVQDAYRKLIETYPDDVVLACGCHEIVEELDK